MKILLAMSGGVDSSVVAHLLKEQGHDVVGVRFSLWMDPLAPAIAQVLPSKCCTTQNIARAATVAKTLGIPLHVLNLEEEFKTTVVDPFLEAHRRGETPNPCIGCNRTIKFGTLLSLAKSLGCEKLATGHYARITESEDSKGAKLYHLLQAKDETKDQSYYLYGLGQDQLSRTMFPLGEMKKTDVYERAVRYGVPLPETYRESQDLCFFPEKTPGSFLKRHIPDAVREGKIVDRTGDVFGKHRGLPLYTIGQRRGLGIGGLRVPLEVVEKNVGANELIVAEKGKEVQVEISLKELRFLSERPRNGEVIELECRTRSLSKRKKGTLTIHGEFGTFRLHTGLTRQSEGQSLVLYRGQEVIGGGIIVR